jgi:hypothetical protein
MFEGSMLSWQYHPNRTPIRGAILALVFFALLSTISLYALVSHLGSRVPMFYNGEFDYYHFHWNLWWVRHAITTGQNPFYTDMVLAPFEHNLSYHSLTASLLPVYAVLEPLVGHLRAANLIIPINQALTGWLMFILLRRQGVSHAVALIGGLALGWLPYMLDHAASGHLNLLTVFWLPVALILWERVASTRSVAWAGLAGLGLWSMWLTDTLIVFWAGLLLAPFALLTLVQMPDRRARVRLVGLGVLALALTFALSWIIGPLRPTLAFDSSDLQPAQMSTLRAYSLPLRALYAPGLGRSHEIGLERDDTPGLLLVALVMVAMVVRGSNRLRWFWLGAAILPLALTLGPDVDLFGARIPLPFRLVHEAFDGQMRTPIRFTPPAITAAIIFLAWSFDPWVRRLRARTIRPLLVGVVALAFAADLGIFRPYPAAEPPPSYDFYAMMRGEHYDDYDYVVLEVPSGPYTGWRPVGSHPEAMAYGAIHEKRMVSGLLSRIPLTKHLFYEQSPLMGWLAGVRPLDSARVIGELNEIVRDWPVGYVVVHQSWMDSARTLETLALFNEHPSLCFIEVEKDAVLYRTTSHPKGCPPRIPPETAPGVYTVDLGLPGDEGFVGHGWYWPEDIGGVAARWAGGDPEALIHASLPAGHSYTLTVRATAFAQPRTVTVVANAERLGQFTAAPGEWDDYTVTIPAALVERAGGDLVFSLTADGVTSAAEQGLSADSRPLGLAYDWIAFRQVGN